MPWLILGKPDPDTSSPLHPLTAVKGASTSHWAVETVRMTVALVPGPIGAHWVADGLVGCLGSESH